MRKDYGQYKISIYGSQKNINLAEATLRTLPLNGDESEDRLTIQAAIDRNALKADILYAGNTVWSYYRVVNAFKKALKSKPSPASDYGPGGEYSLTEYLYKFFTLAAGSIAHYSKLGWISEYPKVSDLVQFCRNNEFGTNIVNNMPAWKTDARHIAQAILDICDNC